ncbi:MAG: response regulator [Elusimicrobia bacterium]|nr:response regulator [Elusimicrobiota bacterium]
MANKLLSTHDIAKNLSVDISTVTNWIDSGKLKAFKTPGGHRRILQKDYVEFVRKYNMPSSDVTKNRLKVLIVDDEKVIRNNVRKIIGKQYPEAEIFEATDGFNVGAILGSEDISLVLLDLKMPGMDGYEVMKQIREDPKLGYPKIVVITGYPHEGLEEKVKELGAQELLIKPFEIKELLDILEDIVRT